MSTFVTCGRCERRYVAQVMLYDGMDRRCAEATARELVVGYQPVPAALVAGLLSALDDERKNLRDEMREAGREIRAMAEEAQYYRHRAEDAEYERGRW